MHATICDMITDLVQNSIEANATEIKLTIEETEKILNVMIIDNGKGMSAAVLEKARDPFYTDGQKHRHRQIGMGLPFLFQTAEMTEGTAAIDSVEAVGTTVSFSFDRTHLDLPVFGNFPLTAVSLMSYGTTSNLKIEHRVNGKSYRVSKAELIDVLGDLNDTESLILLRQFIEGNEEELRSQGL